MNEHQSVTPILSVDGADSEPLWDLNQAGEYLNLKPEFVRRRAQAGEIPGKKIGKYWRFVPSSLVAWAQAN